jgi:hypothetical protein
MATGGTEEVLVVPIGAAVDIPDLLLPTSCCLHNLHLPVSFLAPSSSPPQNPPQSPLLIYICPVGN